MVEVMGSVIWTFELIFMKADVLSTTNNCDNLPYLILEGLKMVGTRNRGSSEAVSVTRTETGIWDLRLVKCHLATAVIYRRILWELLDQGGIELGTGTWIVVGYGGRNQQ